MKFKRALICCLVYITILLCTAYTIDTILGNINTDSIIGTIEVTAYSTSGVVTYSKAFNLEDCYTKIINGSCFQRYIVSDDTIKEVRVERNGVLVVYDKDSSPVYTSSNFNISVNKEEN